MIAWRYLVFLTYFALLPSTANAYIDPGTGSIVLQALLGGIAGIAYLLRLYWSKIKSLFGHADKKTSAPRNDE